MADGDFGGAPLSGAPSPHDLAGYPLNDFGNAMRLIRFAGGAVTGEGEVGALDACTLLHLRGHGWIGFNGRHWDLKGGEGLARKLAARVARGMHAQAEILAKQLQATGAAQRAINEVYDFAESCGNSGRMNAMLAVAKTYLEVDLDAFDRDPLALNLRNGTLFFRRVVEGGRTRVERRWQDRHDPADRISRMAEVEFDPKAEAPVFLAAMAVWQPAAAMRDYVQLLAGYGLTGDTSEQIFIIFQGKGRDGKSTFMNLLRKMLGTYAATAGVQTFLDTGPRKGGDASPDLARLAGDTRLISTAEPPKNAKLADDMIKAFTGGGNVTTRKLKEDIFEFEPVGKVFLECNGRPQPQGGDEGIWRRLKLVLWENQLPKTEAEAKLMGKPMPDKYMPEKLDRERSGVMNWLLAGLERWMIDGVQDPPRVLEVLDDYRKGSSSFVEWMAENLVLDPKASASASELYGNFKAYITERDEKPMSQTAFGRALADLQIIRGRDNLGRIVRHGARLKTASEKAEDAAPKPEGGAGGSLGGGGFELPPEDDEDPFR